MNGPALSKTRSCCLQNEAPGKPEKSYKRECQDKQFPWGSMPVLFCLSIQPNCLNVVSYSESGLLQARGFALCPRAKQSINGSPVWFHFAVVTAPSFSETTSRTIVHSRSGNAWSYRRLSAYGFLRLSGRA